MNQQAIGAFLRELRTQAGLTQEQLAAQLGVSNRSVSRWETGRTMPDFDLLIELAKRYNVSVDEILAAERNPAMEKQTEETLYRIADYTNAERSAFTKRLHVMFIAGVVGMLVFAAIDIAQLYSVWPFDFVAGVGLGVASGMLVVGAIFTSRYAGRIREAKLRVLGRLGSA